MKKTTIGVAAGVLITAMASTAFADSHMINACLITKTDTNPFFVKMKEGASAKAEELGITLDTFAGKIDGDVETQVAAVETCIAGGAKGILITPTDSRALAPVVTQAREAGVLTLLDATALPAGLFQDETWDGRNGRGETVVNGVYIAELSVDFANGSHERILRKVAVVR